MKTRQEKREENAMIAGYSFIIALLILLLLGCIKLLNTA
jgi:lipoprotein